MLIKLAATVAVLTAAVVGFESRAAASDPVSCLPGTQVCVVQVTQPGTQPSAGTPNSGVVASTGQRVCTVPATGAQVSCFDPVWGWWNDQDGCYWKLADPQPVDNVWWEGHYPNGAIWDVLCFPIRPGSSAGGWTWRASPPPGYGGTSVTPAQLAQFLSAIASHPLSPAYHLIAMRGLRRGEACGLRWDDLDLDEGIAYISRQLQQGADGHLRACPLKTESSRRAVALDPETVIVLRALRSRQTRQFAKAGVAPQGWVFTHEDGEPLSPSYLTHTFNDLVEETGLPPVRLHDLRHGAATLMLLAGEELKTIADQLGHSSVVLTADTYLSVAVELGLKAAAAAARLVLKAGKSPPGGGSIRRRSAPVLAEITA